MTDHKSPELSDLLREHRSFPPPDEFRAQANVRDASVYERAERDPEAFWADGPQAATIRCAAGFHHAVISSPMEKSVPEAGIRARPSIPACPSASITVR